MPQFNIILNRIIDKALKLNASYIHLEPSSKPAVRISFELNSLEDEDIISEDFLNQFAKNILSESEQKILGDKKSITVVRGFESGIRFKVQIFYQKNKISAILGYIPTKIKTPEELQLSQQFSNLIKKPKGMLVVSGLHGAGKTATAVSLLNLVNQTEKKYILTLEDPVEYALNSERSIIEQRQIGRDADNYIDSIKFALESDVDIVFISKLTSYKVLEQIINLIDSGRLVVVIVEAGSAPEAIEKIIDLAPAAETEKLKNIIAELLIGVVVQQIMPRRGGGQVFATEILILNEAARSLIKEGRYSQIISIIQTSKDDGMQTLDQSLAELVRTGEIEQQDALQVAIDKVELQSSIHKNTKKSNFN